MNPDRRPHPQPSALRALPRAPRAPLLVLALCLAGLPALSPALPDDREQDLLVDFSRSEAYLDQGRTVFFGRPQKPAVITQGSLRITGLEITLERSASGELMRITATGTPSTPASFQQQPEIDQGIIYGSGRIIVYDNVEGLLTIDVDAELQREGSTVKGHHIDYDLDARVFQASSGEDGDTVQMVIPGSSLDGDKDEAESEGEGEDPGTEAPVQ